MSTELKLLVWSTTPALVQMLIALVTAIAQVGLMPLVATAKICRLLRDGQAARSERTTICWKA
jgi:hypothetical protein